jgi:hypothetical protein
MRLQLRIIKPSDIQPGQALLVVRKAQYNEKSRVVECVELPAVLEYHEPPDPMWRTVTIV